MKRGRGQILRVVSLAIFGLTSVVLLVSSGLYHMLWPGEGRELMKQIDMAAIFALIAGTFTPAFAILYHGGPRVVRLLAIWSAALSGIVFRIAFPELTSGWLGTFLFLVFGWVGAFTAWDLWNRYSSRFVRPLILGGLAYSVGAVSLEFHWPMLVPGVFGPHEFWHLAVLTGLGFHWQFIWQFADGKIAGQPSDSCDAGQKRFAANP